MSFFNPTPSTKTGVVHLKRIHADNELAREASVKQYLMVQTEGDREIQRKVDHYSLQAIIAVGFKIENERAVQDRLFESDFDRLLKQIETDHKPGGQNE